MESWKRNLALFLGVSASSYSFLGLSLSFSALTGFGTYLALGGWKFMRVVLLTLPRDLRGAVSLLKVKWKYNHCLKNNLTIPKLFREVVCRHPSKVAMIFEGREWTFAEIEDYSNSIANHFASMGYKAGDTVAIFMESRPEFVCCWLGLSKLGVVSALINFNLRQDALYHCIKVSQAKSVIAGCELAKALSDVQPKLGKSVEYFVLGGDESAVLPGSTHLDPVLARAATTVPPQMAHRNFSEVLFYIYTSGTTGLPKAAVITHGRFVFFGWGSGAAHGVRSDDVNYLVLPLYHSAGGMLGVGLCLLLGVTTVIRRKFSASNFWSDAIKYNCTVSQYIGEICRYLLAQPRRPTDRQHKIRLMFGNGLRRETWIEFVERFGIARIGEFYGSTEGNANLVNVDNTAGAVGFMTRLFPSLYPVGLIRVAQDGTPLRDSRGLCIPCEPGQPGELVGKIVRTDPTRRFDGYVDGKATEKKVVCDVYGRGDMAFSSGDVLVMDELGYFFFMDRTGDTFRWKGENVSTTEVEVVMRRCVGQDPAVIVYGVEIPGHEGRAGMAAIRVSDAANGHQVAKIDVEQVYRDVTSQLPSYAIPVFLRLLQKDAEMTGTFKLKKVTYVKEGIDPKRCGGDAIYYLDGRQGYKPFTEEVYGDICSGAKRF